MSTELVNLKIDGKAISVPKGTNLIEAAKIAGTKIPHYCYHKHLSVAGNCRMCQVEVKGQPKLAIGCNTQVAEGMEVSTQETSKAAADSQAAVLEFILINHPMDCTICDQAGHCKLQDYHYEYNARPSRFLEEKEHKVKAVPLGPTVMLDGERCIMCTRCIRFCDEITKTSELGMLNRGDRSVIAVAPGKELNNPLSGSVVDLCPVGALTHRNWRFNTRIWFTKQTDGICPGCSTGCNVKVAERDGLVVQVKARSNGSVNKSWLCDEGRYGFSRFLPETPQLEHTLNGANVSLDQALSAAVSGLKGGDLLIVVEPSATLEDLAVIKLFAEKEKGKVVLAHRERKLSDVEKIIISPNYSANIGGAEWLGLATATAAADYTQALADAASGKYKRILFFGDALIGDIPSELKGDPFVVSVVTDSASQLKKLSKVVIAGRSILQRSGLLMNSAQRVQYTDRFVEFATNTIQHWKVAQKLMSGGAAATGNANADRDITLWLLGSEPRLKGLTIGQIKNSGVCMKTYTPSTASAVVQGAA